jgi:hypothetical protein
MSNGKNIVPFELADIETPNCKEAICNGFWHVVLFTPVFELNTLCYIQASEIWTELGQ